MAPSLAPSGSALPRIGATALLLILELSALTLAFDTGDIELRGFAGALIAIAPLGLRLAGLAAVLSCIFVAASGTNGWPDGAAIAAYGRFSRRALAIHAASAAMTVAGCWGIFRSAAPGAGADWLVPAACLAVLTAAVSGCLVFVPAVFWRALARRSPWAAPAGVAIAAVVIVAAQSSRFLIAQPWLRATFGVVAAVLRQFEPNLTVRYDRFLIASRTFEIEISPACSGFEGVALMLVFGAAWLTLYRREFRFPQAFVMIPAGMAAIWVLNCIRIVALFLIGNAGATGVALGGFHSQAGWIAFIGMALAFSMAGQRTPWIAVPRRSAVVAEVRADDHTAAYLLPFLSILAAGMVAQAMSSGFEWAYPLRVAAAAAVLWRFRRAYDGLSWKVGPAGIAAGVLVGGLWIAAELLFDSRSAALAAPAVWTAAPPLVRWGWLAARIAGGILTVPIAEELAFRAYAVRRLIATDFASVDPRRFTWFSFCASSLLFGLLHGKRWIVGLIAGMIFAAIWRRRGSLGDAVAAHSAANIVLAVWATVSGDWRFW